MSKVTVYSKDDCSQCSLVKNFLTNNEVEFEEVNVTHDEAGLQKVKDLGFSAMPVTVVEGRQPFSGFDINNLYSIL